MHDEYDDESHTYVVKYSQLLYDFASLHTTSAALTNPSPGDPSSVDHHSVAGTLSGSGGGNTEVERDLSER